MKTLVQQVRSATDRVDIRELRFFWALTLSILTNTSVLAASEMTILSSFTPGSPFFARLEVDPNDQEDSLYRIINQTGINALCEKFSCMADMFTLEDIVLMQSEQSAVYYLSTDSRITQREFKLYVVQEKADQEFLHSFDVRGSSEGTRIYSLPIQQLTKAPNPGARQTVRAESLATERPVKAAQQAVQTAVINEDRSDEGNSPTGSGTLRAEQVARNPLSKLGEKTPETNRDLNINSSSNAAISLERTSPISAPIRPIDISTNRSNERTLNLEALNDALELNEMLNARVPKADEPILTSLRFTVTEIISLAILSLLVYLVTITKRLLDPSINYLLDLQDRRLTRREKEEDDRRHSEPVSKGIVSKKKAKKSEEASSEKNQYEAPRFTKRRHIRENNDQQIRPSSGSFSRETLKNTDAPAISEKNASPPTRIGEAGHVDDKRNTKTGNIERKASLSESAKLFSEEYSKALTYFNIGEREVARSILEKLSISGESEERTQAKKFLQENYEN